MHKYLKKGIGILLALCTVFASANVFAAGAVTEFDNDTGIGKITYTGNPGRVQEVSLSIYKPDQANAAEGLCWVDQVTTGTAGVATFNFPIKSTNPSGWYTAVIKSDKKADPETVTFYFIQDKSEVVSPFNALTFTDTETFITEYTVTKPVLSPSVTGVPASVVAPYLYSLKTETVATSIEQINNLYDYACILAKLNTKTTASDVLQVLKNDSSALDITIDADFEKYQDDIAAAVLAEVTSDNGLMSYNVLLKAIENTKAVKTINEASASGISTNVTNAILKYHENYGIDEDQFKGYDMDTFSRGLLNKNFNTVGDVLIAYNQRKSEIDESQQGSGTQTGTQGSSRPGYSQTGGNGFSGVLPTIVKGQFTDLAQAEWARDAITFLANKNIINGYDDNSFKPNLQVTREQFVKMLVEAFQFQSSGADCDFADVNSGAWHYSYIASAYKAGIVNGISETEFGVGKNISRQDMAVMIYRCAVKAGYEFDTSAASFADGADIAEYAKEAVWALANDSVINGFEDNTFRPYGVCTRAQAAKVLYEILK